MQGWVGGRDRTGRATELPDAQPVGSSARNGSWKDGRNGSGGSKPTCLRGRGWIRHVPRPLSKTTACFQDTLQRCLSRATQKKRQRGMGQNWNVSWTRKTQAGGVGGAVAGGVADSAQRCWDCGGWGGGHQRVGRPRKRHICTDDTKLNKDPFFFSSLCINNRSNKTETRAELFRERK